MKQYLKANVLGKLITDVELHGPPFLAPQFASLPNMWLYGQSGFPCQSDVESEVSLLLWQVAFVLTNG
jgi:hypothetical protein